MNVPPTHPNYSSSFWITSLRTTCWYILSIDTIQFWWGTFPMEYTDRCLFLFLFKIKKTSGFPKFVSGLLLISLETVTFTTYPNHLVSYWTPLVIFSSSYIFQVSDFCLVLSCIFFLFKFCVHPFFSQDWWASFWPYLFFTKLLISISLRFIFWGFILVFHLEHIPISSFCLTLSIFMY